jgi:uncharacterized protein with HEPN domain
MPEAFLIQRFFSELPYLADEGKTIAVEKEIDSDILSRIDNWREIIGFRNVIAHGYDVVKDEIVWESIINDIPLLLNQLKDIANNR